MSDPATPGPAPDDTPTTNPTSDPTTDPSTTASTAPAAARKRRPPARPRSAGPKEPTTTEPTRPDDHDNQTESTPNNTSPGDAHADASPVPAADPVPAVEDDTDRTSTARPGRGDGGGDTDGPGSQASRLASLAMGEFNLVQGGDGRPYAVERDGPSVALPLRGRDGLRQRLARRYYALTGVAAGGSALSDAMAVIEGMATETDPVTVWLRTARDTTGALVLDLADTTGRAVVITPGRWYLAQRSPVLFRRTTLTSPLPIPATTGHHPGHQPGHHPGHQPGHEPGHESGHQPGQETGQAHGAGQETGHGLPSGLARLRVLLNVDDAGFRLLIGWLVAALVPDIPHPILALLGEQGTAKSTAARFAVSLIDPSPAPLRTPPRDVRSWAVTASASWTVALDNISAVPSWFSDTLCKAVTGDGIIERTLHSDDDVTVLAFRRVIALTSIDAGSLAGDLAERLLPVELHPIPAAARRPDADVEADYQAAAPHVLGALLDLLAAVLAVLPTTRPDRLPRMADFARILAALDVVTGWTTLPDYLALTADGQRQVVDADPLACAVFALLDGQAVGWTGTPTELHDALTATLNGFPPKDWPTARALTGRLRRIAPALRDRGVTITDKRTMHARLVHLTRTPDAPDEAGGGPDAVLAETEVTTG